VPNELMGKRAVDMLIQRLKEPEFPYSKMMLHGELRIRQSMRKYNNGIST
jgi:DNA-binding LacI/PurR family transcriptional regulator